MFKFKFNHNHCSVNKKIAPVLKDFVFQWYLCTPAIIIMPKNAPGFFMKNLTFDENDTPIELLYSYYRGDKYKLELELDEYQMP